MILNLSLPTQMSFRTVYHSDFYKIEIDPENDLLQAEWLRSVNKEEMINGGTMLYQTLLDSGITRAVANAQRLVLLDAETKEWMSKNFYTLLSQTKLSKLARVLPGTIYSKIALESVATRAEAQGINRFEFRNFSNQQDALAWLKD